MAWKEIESTTLSVAAASVSFTTGLTDYKFYRVTAYVLKDATTAQVNLRLNNDSGANYSQQRIDAASTTVSGARNTGLTFWSQATSIAANEGQDISAVIAKPSATVKAQITFQTGIDASGGISLGLLGGEWNNTADLISRLDLLASSGNFAAGTSILLEGLSG